MFIDDGHAPAAIQRVQRPVVARFAFECQRRADIPGARRIGHAGRPGRLERLFVIVDARRRDHQPCIAIGVSLPGAGGRRDVPDADQFLRHGRPVAAGLRTGAAPGGEQRRDQTGGEP